MVGLPVDSPSRYPPGRSEFRGMVLDAADFSHADLRGVDFSGAHLNNVDFSHAKLGLRPLVGWTIIVLAILASVAAGAVAGASVEAIRGRLADPSWERSSGAGAMVVIMATFVGVLIWKGIDVAIKSFLIVFAVALGLSVISQAFWGDIDMEAGARGIGLVLLLAMAVLAGILGRVVGGTFGAWAIALVALLGGLAAGQAQGGGAALVISLLSVLISKRALHADRRDRKLRLTAHRLIRRWGTQFVAADLTGSDFTGTSAEQCNVTGADLTDVRWEPGHAPLSVEPVMDAS